MFKHAVNSTVLDSSELLIRSEFVPAGAVVFEPRLESGPSAFVDGVAV
jgi:hypothetical protein